MNNQNQNTSEEINLSLIWQNLMGLIDKIGFYIFRFFRFILRNIYIFITLIVIGVALGYFLDYKKADIYKHQIILALNFDSSSFLYNKTKHLNKKEFPEIKTAKIEPIIDVYSFISEKWETFKSAEFMSENNMDIHRYKEGSQTAKIYRYHTLTLTSDKKDINGSVINTFLDKVNNEPHYLNRQKIEIENTALKIKEFEKSIEDLNLIFESLGSSTPVQGSGIKIETQAQTNDLLNNKQNLIDKVNKLKIVQAEQSKVFYDLTRITNIKVKSTSYILLLPLLFLTLFISFKILKKLNRRYF